MRSIIPFSRSSLTRPFFDEFDKIFNEVFSKDFFSNGVTQRAYPKINIYKKDNSFCIDACVADIPKDKLYVNIDDNVLTIKGEAYSDNDVDDSDYFVREVSHRSFERSIMLDKEVDINKIDAQHKDGMLKIKIPFLKEALIKSKKIDIK